jgi:RNA polymerase sigma-70 factor (ECF subfamily)
MPATPKRPQDDTSSSSEEWGRLLRRGDVDAVRHVRERVRKILGYRRLAIPNHDRDDLEQEVMVELWRAVNRPGFDFSAGFWGFVEVVTSRRCIDWLRSQRTPVRLLESIRDERSSPLDSLLDDERAGIARHALERLDSECKMILTMRIQHRLPYREIAEHLGKSEGAVRVQVHRCIRRAQQLISESGEHQAE